MKENAEEGTNATKTIKFYACCSANKDQDDDDDDNIFFYSSFDT